MCLISVQNLKEIHTEEDYFFWLKGIVSNRCEEEEKYGQFLEMHISKMYLPDFLKFGMSSRVYEGHKIHKFDRNLSSSYRDMRCWKR